MTSAILSDLLKSSAILGAFLILGSQCFNVFAAPLGLTMNKGAFGGADLHDTFGIKLGIGLLAGGVIFSVFSFKGFRDNRGLTTR